MQLFNDQPFGQIKGHLGAGTRDPARLQPAAPTRLLSDRRSMSALNWEPIIGRRREVVQRLDDDLTAARNDLAYAMVRAQAGGASIADLMQWTGYSRRQVFNLLARAKETAS